ncbi:hypothetical protein D9M68_437230 [compost metagenome]
MDRAPRHHVMVDFQQHSERLWMVREEDHLKLEKDLERAHMRIREMDLLFGRYILAMRSAVIEQEHGKGAEGAMIWIFNSLAGPGELPPEDETDAQAYFDREIKPVEESLQEIMRFWEADRQAKAAKEVKP